MDCYYYIIWDTQEKKQVGRSYQTRSKAAKRADDLDNEYGAYRYQVCRVEGSATGY